MIACIPTAYIHQQDEASAQASHERRVANGPTQEFGHYRLQRVGSGNISFPLIPANSIIAKTLGRSYNSSASGGSDGGACGRGVTRCHHQGCRRRRCRGWSQTGRRSPVAAPHHWLFLRQGGPFLKERRKRLSRDVPRMGNCNWSNQHSVPFNRSSSLQSQFI